MTARPVVLPRDVETELRRIPGVGRAMAMDLYALGVRRVADLAKIEAQDLYDRLCRLSGVRQDPCVLYTFRCAVYFARNSEHDPELLKWWNWKDRT